MWQYFTVISSQNQNKKKRKKTTGSTGFQLGLLTIDRQSKAVQALTKKMEHFRINVRDFMNNYSLIVVVMVVRLFMTSMTMFVGCRRLSRPELKIVIDFNKLSAPFQR